MTFHYDPNHSPEPKQWLGLAEQERLQQVVEFHRRETGTSTQQARQVHAVLHTVVENQLALGEPITARPTLERLIAAGLSRHDAIHAMGRAVLENSNTVLQDEGSDANNDYRVIHSRERT